MASHRTSLAVAALATAVALVGCTGESSSEDTPTSSAGGTTASSTSPGSTAAPTSPQPGTASSGSTPPTSPSSSSKTATPEGPAPTGSDSSSAGQPGSPHTSSGSASADKTPSGPTLTLKVEGAAKLKVTKITVKGTLTQTVKSPTTLTVSVDPSLKIGYTITAVALSGTIDSCTVTTPKGTTKPVTPSSGACTTTYTPGG